MWRKDTFYFKPYLIVNLDSTRLAKGFEAQILSIIVRNINVADGDYRSFVFPSSSFFTFQILLADNSLLFFIRQ